MQEGPAGYCREEGLPGRALRRPFQRNGSDETVQTQLCRRDPADTTLLLMARLQAGAERALAAARHELFCCFTFAVLLLLPDSG